jgi:hypothetical protein
MKVLVEEHETKIIKLINYYLNQKHTPRLNENARAGFKRGFDEGV